MPTITAIDVIGIQSYVFASNRLRDVIGASHWVGWATGAKAGGGLTLHESSIGQPAVLVAAGGNAILQFPNLDEAKQFVRQYSRQLLERAPGLDVAIAHHDYETGNLPRALLELQIKLAQAKLQRRPHAPQFGLSIMQPCAVTGLPASVKRQEDDSWISSKIARLRDEEVREQVRVKWQQFLPDISQLPSELHQYSFAFPEELDQMGRSHGDTSRIGVVHIDGDGVGQRIQRWLVWHVEKGTDDQQVQSEYTRWSNALHELGEAVFRQVVGRIAGCLESMKEEVYVAGQSGPQRDLDFPITIGDGSIKLPLRPILLGGDDLTFVCDGRIALDLAATALRTFQSESARLDDLRLLGDESLTACAGIAVVNAHAPFDHSYRLCEKLCAHAKAMKRVAEREPTTSSRRCWLDWHIGSIRPGESVNEIRQRQYQNGKLACRPYPLDGESPTELSWQWLDLELLGPSVGEHGTCSFRNPEAWGARRNKVKALANLVHEGNDAVRQNMEAWQIVDAELKLPDPIARDGFFSGRTPLLDAVELLDLHLRLSQQNSIAESTAYPKEASV